MEKRCQAVFGRIRRRFCPYPSSGDRDVARRRGQRKCPEQPGRPGLRLRSLLSVARAVGRFRSAHSSVTQGKTEHTPVWISSVKRFWANSAPILPLPVEWRVHEVQNVPYAPLVVAPAPRKRHPPLIVVGRLVLSERRLVAEHLVEAHRLRVRRVLEHLVPQAARLAVAVDARGRARWSRSRRGARPALG